MSAEKKVEKNKETTAQAAKPIPVSMKGKRIPGTEPEKARNDLE